MKIACKYLMIIIPIFGISQNQNATMIQKLNLSQKKIILDILREDAKISFLSVQHQKNLDSILVLLPQDPFFWQQKAMPLFSKKNMNLG